MMILQLMQSNLLELKAIFLECNTPRIDIQMLSTSLFYLTGQIMKDGKYQEHNGRLKEPTTYSKKLLTSSNHLELSKV